MDLAGIKLPDTVLVRDAIGLQALDKLNYSLVDLLGPLLVAGTPCLDFGGGVGGSNLVGTVEVPVPTLQCARQ
jgi:hypothetical protein